MPSRNLRLVGHEEIVKMPRKKSGGAGLFGDYLYYVLTVKVAGFTQECLFFLDMIIGIVKKGVVISTIRISGYGVGDGSSR